MAAGPRQGRPYRRSAARLRAEGLPCWLCRGAIDYAAPPRTRWSFSVDHEPPLSKGGHPHDPAGLRPAHYGCNSGRGNRPASRYQDRHAEAQSQAWGHLPTSRDWSGRGGAG
jgi:hypothetical protein